jgi:hypothetical protein
MKRKTLLGLVPLVVIAALAVSPVAAQAENPFKCEEGGTCPRILQNGTEEKLSGGAKLPILSWGTLQLENSKLGLITCKNAFGGSATDPGAAGPGDARGAGEVLGYTAYGCSSTVCEAGGEPVEVTPLGKGTNPLTKAKEVVQRITVPWETSVLEPKEKEWKLHVGNKVNKEGEAKFENKILFKVVCAAQALAAEFHGELNILGEAGTLIGSAPATLTFKGAESGELESSIGTGTVKGKVKLQGYGTQEVLSVENR